MKLGLLPTVSNVLEFSSVVSFMSLNLPVTLTTPKTHNRLAKRHSTMICVHHDIEINISKTVDRTTTDQAVSNFTEF